LSIGFAEQDVSPKLDGKRPVYLAGFGQNRKATKINDPIMSRAVVLSDAKTKIALVSVDVVGLFNDVAMEVRKQLKGYDYICVSSTHNHEGPDTMGLWGSSPFNSGIDPDYMTFLHKEIARTIEAADKVRQPATAKIGTIKAPELLTDNRKPYVKADELVALQFFGKENKPIGILVQWNCHPETLDSKNTHLSADYVGYTVKELQKTHGCAVAYFTGVVGGLMTSLDVPVKNAKGELLKDGTFEKTEEYGKLVAQAATKALKSSQPVELTPFEIRTTDIHLPVQNRLYQLGWRAGVLKRTMYIWEDNPFPKAPQEGKDLSKPCGIKTEIGYLKLGELEVAIIPGEIYPELVLGKVEDPVDPGADFPEAPVEPHVYQHFKAKYRMVIGLGNDEIGYIIPKRQWDAKAPYCYGLKKDQYGEENSIGPDAAPLLMKAFADLVNGKK
jgi:hypothetical protein